MPNCLRRRNRALFYSLLALIGLTFIAATHTAKADENPDRSNEISAAADPAEADWQLSVKGGYRQDDLDWSIAGQTPTIYLDPGLQGKYVNILSELTWRDVEIFQLDFGLEKRFQRRFRITGRLGIGLITDGEVQDSDYAGDNRTFEFSRAYADSNEGYTWDLSVGFGHEFSFWSETINLSPFFGLSYHAQNLNLTNGFQAISAYGWESVSATGPFRNLDSTYDTSWMGPWIGLEVAFHLQKDPRGQARHELILGLEYHLAQYYAEADWNLRDDLQHPKSFEHEADGTGVILKLAYQFHFRRPFYLIAAGTYQNWDTDSGTHQVFFADGTFAETPLNEVNWQSFAISLGVGARF